MAVAAEAILSPTPQASSRNKGDIAAQLAVAIQHGDILFAAADEQQAFAIAQALSAAAPDAMIAFCPGSDALPGDDAPASAVNVGQRVSAFRRIRLALAEEPRVPVACITTGEALGRLYPPPAAFDAAPPRVAVGDQIELPALHDRLTDAGYVADDRVDEQGEIALRGQVLDVFPADTSAPLRIEVADGIVSAIRIYDPIDQRTTGQCDEYELGHVTEPTPNGTGVTLLDHLPGARIVISTEAEDRRRRFVALAEDAGRRRPARAVRDVAGEAIWADAVAARERIVLVDHGDGPPRFVEAKRPLKLFAKTAKDALAGGRRVALLGSERDLRFLTRHVASVLGAEIRPVGSWAEIAAADPGSVLALVMPVEHGFSGDGVLAIAAADLLGSRAERIDAKSPTAAGGLIAAAEIRTGDVVVHEDHGIGVVAGLKPLPAVDDAEPGDAIALTYAEGGVRLVPTADADRIWRYGAEEEAVTLDRLDGASWTRRRSAIDAAIAESARALTKLAAERAAQTAPVLKPDPDAYERFAAGFPFAETVDQMHAIAAVRHDLGSGMPMDRLVIGDVGYGKTEVALRAAAVAALGGFQVAVAAPTTVLARQHLESFTARFEGSGLIVAGLSRFSSAAEKRRVKAGLADGSTHIVVGTGAIAAKGMAYDKLALVVIDEEQRFGAADKERMRGLSAGHVLTLSATPIPRTLQAALVGLQQLSVLATPPARRRPIRTSVGPFVTETVRIALLREKSRGGQSFVVVPRIEDMPALVDRIAEIVPELTLVQAHGQMPVAEIDEAMIRFGQGEGDVLLATNIIEAGLDIPRANTMLVWHADRFGLSQLHQLRGRVGRGSRRGQVLLLTDPGMEIAPRTLKRLKTIEAFDRLGAGFAISARDLDMRGAGDLLGEAQAGHMKLIGTDLYQHLLAASLRAARGEDVERWTPELNVALEGRLPERWIPDEDIRVDLYCRLARLEDVAGLDSFAAELEDRFGSLPAEAEMVLRLARVRVASRQARIARIDAGPAAIAFTPRRDFRAGTAAAAMIKKGDRLLLAEAIEEPGARLDRVEAILQALADDEQED